jgi:hypothetical protein
VRSPHPGLGDLHHHVGQARRDPLEHRAVHFEGAQVARVDPDDPRTGGQRPVRLVLGVHLDQRGHPQRLDPFQQPDQGVLLQGGHDQQDQVGAVRARLVHLVAGHHEVLAQQRHLDRRPHRVEVLQAPAEPARLGQHRHAARAAGRVLLGQVGRVGDVGERALRRRRPLDLGDHPDAGLAQQRVRVQRGWCGRRQVADLRHRYLLLAGRDIVPYAGQDLVEHALAARG